MADRSVPANSRDSSRTHHRHRSLLFWIGAILFLAIVGLFITGEILLHRAEPILRARVVESLAARFDSRVELHEFHVSLVRGLEVTGGGLKLYPNKLDDVKPLFEADEFSFHTSWENLLKTPMHIGLVHVRGLDINLPPKNLRRNIPRLNGAKQTKIKIYVDRVLIDNATLILGTDKPGKVPLDFEIQHLTLDSVGANEPMRFQATLVNPKPIGNIASSGHFGPFHEDSPGDTAVDGTYTFDHADLSTLKGIGGMLSSHGKYEGTLEDITVDGETDTPDFRISTGGHSMPLHTTFHAIVDGTNGDTYLQPVNAQILHSHIVASGKVVRVPDRQGHHIVLDLVVDQARIEDMLQLAVRTQPPVMDGNLRLRSKFDLPPGEADVPQRLRLNGNFQILDAKFSNPAVQAKVDQLSLRSQGKADEAKETNAPASSVASDMKGNFALASGRLIINGLNFDVPGANIAMNGVYSLDGNEFDFHGKARLKAHVSELVTGWKSVLLKPIDPFFAKNGVGTEVPIKVTGTKSEPKFGLDFGRKDDKDQSPNLRDKTKDSGPIERTTPHSEPKVR